VGGVGAEHGLERDLKGAHCFRSGSHPNGIELQQASRAEPHPLRIDETARAAQPRSLAPASSGLPYARGRLDASVDAQWDGNGVDHAARSPPRRHNLMGGSAGSPIDSARRGSAVVWRLRQGFCRRADPGLQAEHGARDAVIGEVGKVGFSRPRPRADSGAEPTASDGLDHTPAALAAAHSFERGHWPTMRAHQTPHWRTLLVPLSGTRSAETKRPPVWTQALSWLTNPPTRSFGMAGRTPP